MNHTTPLQRGAAVLAVLCLALASSSCDEAEKLAGECGLACPGSEGPDGVEIKGLLEGNAAISGVAKVDAFFAAVNNFRGTADNVSAGINAELDKIAADFGIVADSDADGGVADVDIAAALRAKFEANLEGRIQIDYQPARCAVDASATIEAKARCEGEINPPEVSVECKGSCELEAEAELECSAEADLECTFTGPTVMCQGECSGTCEAMLSGSAMCDGTCRGDCSGTCSAYVKDGNGATKCAGSCSGMCTGSCELKAKAGVKCMGTCRGECTVKEAEASCEGSARASCRARGDASIMCEGKCDGEFKPPSADVECEASARAEAKLNVECTPPSVQARYVLKAGVSAMAQAEFEGALKTMIKVRLPALLAALARAESVRDAGVDLGAAGRTAVKGAITAAQGDAGIRAKAGLLCAAGEIDKVPGAIKASADRLAASIEASGKITTMLGM